MMCVCVPALSYSLPTKRQQFLHKFISNAHTDTHARTYAFRPSTKRTHTHHHFIYLFSSLIFSGRK